MALPHKPVSHQGWRALWLGLLAAAWGFLFPLLGNWITAILYAPERDLGPLMRLFGSSGVMIAWLLAAAAILASILALRKGDRSWPAMIGLALALLAGGFWLLFALGEFLMAH